MSVGLIPKIDLEINRNGEEKKRDSMTDEKFKYFFPFKHATLIEFQEKKKRGKGGRRGGRRKEEG